MLGKRKKKINFKNVSKAKNPMSNAASVYQFKITLADSGAKIWRRILVPSHYTFFELHVAIQNAMGWFDGHLHSFDIVQKETTRPLSIRFPDPENDSFYGETFPDERVEKIADYFPAIVKQCVYTYDFGDNWDHTILFERELPKEAGVVYPQCLAGANACPPENCGGVYGYEKLQKILKNPDHSEHQDMLEWLCIDDPSELDPTEFNCVDVEFDDTKSRLKEYEKGFGVKSARRTAE